PKLRGAAVAARAPDGPEESTDEAALLEASGARVVTVLGDADNLKVTTPEDLERAGAILAHRLGPPPVGQGRDSHPFGPQGGPALGGIVTPPAPRLHGHSDGDVALHAVADALLGATGQGDLGRIFPAGDPSTRGGDSRALLAGAQRARGAPACQARPHRPPARPGAGGRLRARLVRQPRWARGCWTIDRRAGTRHGDAAMTLRFRNTLGGALEEFVPLATAP